VIGVDVAATIFSTGWTSGINSYATVLVLSLLGRAGVGGVPEGLDQDWVLLAAAGMFTVEFFTDKIPYLDSAWDSIHTVIRPLIGAVLGFSFAPAAPPEAAPVEVRDWRTETVARRPVGPVGAGAVRERETVGSANGRGD
jgi:hypothetical protein